MVDSACSLVFWMITLLTASRPTLPAKLRTVSSVSEISLYDNPSAIAGLSVTTGDRAGSLTVDFTASTMVPVVTSPNMSIWLAVSFHRHSQAVMNAFKIPGFRRKLRVWLSLAHYKTLNLNAKPSLLSVHSDWLTALPFVAIGPPRSQPRPAAQSHFK